jgi:dihydroxyacetone kinase-like predicted kinase
MSVAMHDVVTGEITTATRSVEIDGVHVTEGQVIALLNSNLVLAASDIKDACLGLLEKAEAENHELITLFMEMGWIKRRSTISQILSEPLTQTKRSNYKKADNHTTNLSFL